MEKARELIAEHLGVPCSSVRDHVTFRELGADSLDLSLLTLSFEEAFDLLISDEQAETCSTVGDALQLLDHQLRLRDEQHGRSSKAELANVRG
jgi:acyl carrier protein